MQSVVFFRFWTLFQRDLWQGPKLSPAPRQRQQIASGNSKKNDECFTKTTRNFLIDLWGLRGGSRQRSLVLEVGLDMSLKLATLPCKNAPSEAKLFEPLICGGLGRRKYAHLPYKNEVLDAGDFMLINILANKWCILEAHAPGVLAETDSSVCYF